MRHVLKFAFTLAGLCAAAVTNVRVIATTPTSAAIAYTAPDVAVCQLEVSEDSSYSPLVYDVDTSKFTGEDADTRVGNLTTGRGRVFVVGKTRSGVRTSTFTSSDTTDILTVTNPPWGNGLLTISGGSLSCGLTAAPKDLDLSLAATGFTQIVDSGTTAIVYSTGHGLSACMAIRLTAGVSTYSNTASTSTPSFSVTSNEVTATLPSGHKIVVGSVVTVAGVTGDLDLNGPWTVTASDATTITFTSVNVSDGTYDNDGIALSVGDSDLSGTYVIQSVTADTFNLTSTSVTDGTYGYAAMSYSQRKTFYPRDISGDTFKVAVKRGSEAIDLETSGSGTFPSNFSRALQANTQHYFRITCGVDTATGTFRTRNLAWGSLHNPGKVSDGAGGYLYPTIDPNSRDPWIDPSTGIQVRAIKQDDDYTSGSTYDSGHQTWCQSIEKLDSSGNPGFYCAVPGDGASSAAYWISRDTGEARFLGRLTAGSLSPPYNAPMVVSSAGWDPNNVGRWCGMPSSSGGIVCGTLTGSVDADKTPVNVNVTADWTLLESDVEAALETFTASYGHPFDAAGPYGCGGTRGFVGEYVYGVCTAGTQDRLGWLYVVDVTDGSIVAAIASWNTPEQRWCSIHSVIATRLGNIADHGGQVLTGQGGAGGYSGKYEVSVVACSGDGCSGGNTITACTEPCQTTLTVTSSHSIPGEPYSVNVPNELTDYDGTPMVTEVGDNFRWNAGGNEYLHVNQKNSPTEWISDRGYRGTVPLAAGALPQTIYPYCTSWPGWLSYHDSSWRWDFINSPDGLDPDYTYVSTQFNGIYSHHDDGYGYAVASGNKWSVAAITSSADTPSADGIIIQYSSQFSDSSIAVGGNDWTSHPRGPEVPPSGYSPQKYALDSITLEQAQTDMEPDGVTSVTGDLYLVTNSGFTEINYRQMPLFVMLGSKYAADISGPSSSITGDPSYNYSMCYALNADECYAGSSPGDLYVNSPEDISTPVTGGFCSGSIPSLTYDDDVCPGLLPPWGESIVRFQLDRNRPHHKSVQRLMMMPALRLTAYLNAAGALPGDGERGRWGYTLVKHPTVDEKWPMAFLMPPVGPEDSIPRDDYIMVPRKLTPPSSLGVDNAIIEFGYDDNGHVGTELKCHTRDEVCVAPGDGEWYWASESYSGIACSTSCTIDIPAISGQVVYYRWKYRDVSNNVLATSRIEVLEVP